MKWPSRLILSRHQVLIATSGLVAGASVLLRHVLSEASVATACSCRDLFSLQLMSRQLIDVATFWSLQLLSRQPGVVATSILHNFCHNILMLLRPLLCTIAVATSGCCRDLFSSQWMSRQSGFVATLSSVELLSRELSPFKLMSQLLQMQG